MPSLEFRVTILLCCAASLLGNSALAIDRQASRQMHGGQKILAHNIEHLEWQSGEGEPAIVLETESWYGGDIHRWVLATDSEYSLDENSFEEVALDAHYRRAVAPFWNIDAGLRQAIRSLPTRSYALLGVTGTAPYWIEVDAKLLVSDRGQALLELELEHELRISQQMVLGTKAEVSAAFENDRERDVGTGIGESELALRLSRPLGLRTSAYIGASWKRLHGATARMRDDHDKRIVSVLLGTHYWF